jgi:ABC-2 type transport system ATP-binding protein
MPKLKFILSNFSKSSDKEFDEHCESLKKYIAYEIHNGNNIYSIKQVLLEKGWDISHITEAFRRYNSELKEGFTDIHPNNLENNGNYQEEKSEEIILRISNLSKYFGNNHVLDKININVPQGEIIGIIGLSGSGKSTLLNHLIGLYKPDGGVVAYKDHDSNRYFSVIKNDKKIRNIFGFSPQDPSFYRRLTTLENLDHFAALHNIKRDSRKQKVEKLLFQMGLLDAKKTLGGNLSGGMQRRLGIACSIIHNPKILILDEPTADLDPFMRKGIWNLIKEINSQGTTVILTSHFLSEVEGLCSKIAILHNKKICAYGSLDFLKDSFSKDKEIILDTENQKYECIIKDLEKRKISFSKAGLRGNKFVIYSNDSTNVLHSVLHSVESSKDIIKDIDLNKPSLNEIFEDYIINKEKVK